MKFYSSLLMAAGSLLAFAAGADTDATHGVFTGQIKSVLYVEDVEASADFFRGVLGFEFLGFAELDGQPYYAEMAAGRSKFGLHEPTREIDRDRVGRQRLYFRVRDLEAHRLGVEARRGSPSQVRETSWMDMFTVIDPDGHEIVFATTDSARHSTDPWSVSVGEDRDEFEARVEGES